LISFFHAAIIKSNHLNDSRRSYQCIKFLVALATKCGVAKDYLMQSSTKWQWAVNWLKKKMTEYYWPSASASTTASNEDSSGHDFQRTISAQVGAFSKYYEYLIFG
jgi:ubiquitin carboxyl-terminal hydrolase 9/24